VPIERVEVFPVAYPLSGYFKFFGGKPRFHVVLVKLVAQGGTAGWGQSLPVPNWSYETPETAVIVLEKYLGPALVGCDPLDIEGAHRAMDRALAPSFSTAMPIARAGLDLALHDLAGKLTGRSIAAMWNRPRGGPITLSWTINVRSLDEADAQVEAGLVRGYCSFNVKIGQDPALDVELVRRVRRLAPGAYTWADANCGYDLATALEVAPKLAECGAAALESPLRPNRMSGYQALRRQGALPILMDEGLVSPVDLEEFIRLDMLDGAVIKVSRAGGLVSARRQIEMLEAAGLVWLGSGLTDPDISLAATLALFGAYGLGKPAALVGPQFLTADVLSRPLEIHDGLAEVPVGPGLGVEVDEGKVRAMMEGE